MASGTYPFGYDASAPEMRQPLLSTTNIAQYNGYYGRLRQNDDHFSSTSIKKTTRFLDDHETYDYKCGLSPVRRMFCLLALFDFLFIFLMWIIYAQLFSTGLEQQFKDEVIHYSFNSSLFDLVCCALLRTLCLGAVYALLRSKKWYLVGLTTAASTVFIIVKVFKVGNSLSKGQPMSYLLLIVSFIICWSEVWHFDFQVIPTELKHAKKQLTSSLPTVAGEDNKSYRSWFGRPSEIDQRSFYTANALSEPVSYSSDSEDSFLSDTSESRSLPELKKRQLIKEGKDAVRVCLRMLFITDGWKLEKEERDDIVVVSREFDDIGKVFKCVAKLDCPCAFLHKILWEDIASQPSWNPSITECQIVKKLDRNTDLCYVLATEAAGGLIKSRDFLTVRHSKQKGDLRLSCGISSSCDFVPEKKGIIRAENGPGGFILKDISDNQEKTELTWLMNSNLKGWIPQKVIDQTMGTVLVDTIRSLRGHIASLPQV